MPSRYPPPHVGSSHQQEWLMTDTITDSGTSATQDDTHRQGRFVWYDLMTTDPQAAVAFYTKVLGWTTAPFDIPGEAAPYTMWQAGDTPDSMVGGVAPISGEMAGQGVVPHWIAYVSTSDVDATAEQATRLGAQVLHGPDDIPTVGRFAILQDPQGAVIAVYKGLQEMSQAPYDPQVKQFSWHELATTDAQAAFDFYSSLFGWEKTGEMDMGELGPYLMYGQNGV